MRAFRRVLGETDDLAEFGVLDNSTWSSQRQPDGTVRHSATLRMMPVPPEYAAVYRRRGMEPPHAASRFDPASLWPYLPREPHEQYAKRQGYFWLPCPLCGKDFGGHEIGDTVYLGNDDPNINSCICPVCTAERNGGEP